MQLYKYIIKMSIAHKSTAELFSFFTFDNKNKLNLSYKIITQNNTDIQSNKNNIIEPKLIQNNTDIQLIQNNINLQSNLRPSLEELNIQSGNKSKSTYKKKSIPKSVKINIWNTYIGDDIMKHKCFCCKRTTIKINDFEAGHVLSEANGGTNEIKNFRPICRNCNLSMGTTHMEDYIKKYGLYI